MLDKSMRESSILFASFPSIFATAMKSAVAILGLLTSIQNTPQNLDILVVVSNKKKKKKKKKKK
jgi:hypothetical protein